MKPESMDLQHYLKPTVMIDSDHPDIRARVDSLLAGMDNEVQKARCLFEWVRDEIPHAADIDSDLNPCKASDVLRAGTGMCYAKSHLLAAFLRAAGIPAGFCYQRLKRDSPFDGFVIHGLNGVYLRSEDRWIRLDARGNKGRINARFDIVNESLAFDMDSGAGEFVYETIYHDPAPVVIHVLEAFASRRDMWPHLPAELAER